MLRHQPLRYLPFNPLSRQLSFIYNYRPYSSRSTEDDEDDLDAARQWFSKFKHDTIPTSIAKTTFSRSSGAGGQKVNKTSSKATTVWLLSSLQNHVPKILIPELRSCRYYVRSSDSVTIQCDSSRSQPENTQETHRKLAEEIKQIYKKRVPGVTSPEKIERIQKLRKSENAMRLKMKKSQSDKKQSRSSGRSWDG